MKTTLLTLFAMTAILTLSGCATQSKKETCCDKKMKIMTLDPGHFHAALVQKNMYADVDSTVFVYAPDGNDLNMHLKRIEGFNTRSENPTHWNLAVYRGEDFFQKMIEEKKGNVLVTAGNNEKKTFYIKAAVENGINVLADKPMVINTENFNMLLEAFDIADKNNVLIYDIMTERFEITTILQKELSLIPDLFGTLEPGTPENPSVTKESVHHFFKTVAGSPLIRPQWFFDVTQQGEGIVDVTTHLVDLVQWECFPEQVLDYKTDVEIIDANRWTTPINKEEWKQVTGTETFPEYLSNHVAKDVLNVYANGDITYKLKGVTAKVSVIWNYAAPQGGGDTHYSIMRGTKANLIIRQGAEQQYKPSLYIEPADGIVTPEFEEAAKTAVSALESKYLGISLGKSDKGYEVIIPQSYHVGHESHFGQVTEKFLEYFKAGKLPDWEVPNMITKYYTTTRALEVAMGKTK